jgi:uroporphyrinogen decarboxylase
VSLFVRAARREETERTPVWFMRQAGRVLPEYRAMRERWSLIEICRAPQLCAEVTLQPMRRMPLDAAVMFADIMLPLVGVGIDLDLVDNVGPVIRRPIRSAADIVSLRPIEPAADVPFVLETIGLVKQELGPERAVIGFAGAPFTLASYLIEGRPSREFALTKTLMYAEPALWHELMERLTSIMTAYLRAQVSAGIDALQLFDSWVGTLSPQDYAEYVEPYSRRIFAALAPASLPMIHFGTNTAGLLDLMKTDGATIIGVDWRVPLDEARARTGGAVALQGNLDPAACLAPWPAVAEQVRRVLDESAGHPAYVFNLGHGVLPETDPDVLARVVDLVHAEGRVEPR